MQGDQVKSKVTEYIGKLKPGYSSANNGESKLKCLDMLCISHFHNDHINGVKELLENFENLKLLVMPYTSIYNRIFDYCADMENFGNNNIAAEDIVDPISIIKPEELKIKKIAVLGASEGRINKNEHDGISEFPDSPKQHGDKESKIKVDLPPENEELRSKAVSDDSEILKKYPKMYFLDHKDDIFLRSDEQFWKFKFYVFKFEEGIREFYNQFQKKVSEGKINDCNGDWKAILSDKTNLKNIREVYKEVAKKLGMGGKINSTSLALHHQSLPEREVRGRRICYGCSERQYPKYCWGICMRRHGELLFGDMPLVDKPYFRYYSNDRAYQKDKRYLDFISHYGVSLENTTICQVPHHGSKDNWNPNLIKDLKSCNHYIISGEMNSKYHPQEVIDNLMRNKKQILVPDIHGDISCWGWIF